MMRAYAETRHCRRAFLLSYFGEPFDAAVRPLRQLRGRAGGRGRAGRPCRSRSARASRHAQWGEGVVQRYDDDAVVVLFDDVGYKTLAIDVVVERRLLRAA